MFLGGQSLLSWPKCLTRITWWHLSKLHQLTKTMSCDWKLYKSYWVDPRLRAMQKKKTILQVLRQNALFEQYKYIKSVFDIITWHKQQEAAERADCLATLSSKTTWIKLFVRPESGNKSTVVTSSISVTAVFSLENSAYFQWIKVVVLFGITVCITLNTTKRKVFF